MNGENPNRGKLRSPEIGALSERKRLAIRAEPYTKDRLVASFDSIKRQLVKDRKIRPGLTFHGLRKSLGKAAADAGFSENDIAGALGQANPASARVYAQNAGRNQGGPHVFKGLSKRK